MDEELKQMLKYIRLGGLLANWDQYLSAAQKGNYSHVRLLKYVVEQEYQIKKENSRKMRLTRAKIPEKFVIETFPFTRQPKLNKKKIVNMYDGFDYMSKCRNVIWAGHIRGSVLEVLDGGEAALEARRRKYGSVGTTKTSEDYVPIKS